MKRIAAADIADGLRVLTDDLANAVARAARRAVKADIKRIQNGLRSGDLLDAQRVARELKFTDVIKDAEKPIRKFTRASALLGAGAVTPPKETIWAQGAPFDWEIDVGAVRQIQAVLTYTMNRDVPRRLERLVTDAIRFEGDRVEKSLLLKGSIDPNVLAAKINATLRGESYRVVEVGSNLTGTRVAAFGMLAEAMMTGVGTYRIDAVLDERTTEICRNMDGRTFQVEDSYTRTKNILQITDPNALKRAAPFLDEVDAKIYSSEELQARGHAVPPFHFLCRSVVTLVSQETKVDAVDYSLFEKPAISRRKAQEAHWKAWPEMVLPNMFATAFRASTLVNKDIKSPDELKAFIAKEIKAKKEARDPDGLFGDADADDYDPLKGGHEVVSELNAWTEGRDRTPYWGVQKYTGGSYSDINIALRDNERLPYRDLREAIVGMDEAFKDSILQEDIVVWRGVGSRVGDRMEVGKVFQDDGFSSTSLFAPKAADFAGYNGTVVQLIIPKGTPAIYVEKFTNVPGEFEVVLPRSSQFRIISDQGTVNLEPLKDFGTERRVIRAVWQGQGEYLDVDDIGVAEKPVAVNVIKQYVLTEEGIYDLPAEEAYLNDIEPGPDHPLYGKWVWTVGDLREVPLN